MTNIQETAAKILVERGYAESYRESSIAKGQYLLNVDDGFDQRVAISADTLEGRKQADAIEDWLYTNHYLNLWLKSKSKCGF